MSENISKNLEPGDKNWTFTDGSKRTAVELTTVFIGRGEYKPGWRWSKDVGEQSGKPSEAHIGYIISGRMMVKKGADGEEVEVGPGDAFEVTAGHDAWVLGDEPCVALDFGQLK